MQSLRPAEAHRHAFFRIPEGDPHHIDLLQILLERRGKGKIPVGRRDDDLLRRGKLPRQIEHRVSKLPFGDEPVPPLQEGLVRHGKSDLLQPDFHTGFLQLFQKSVRQPFGPGVCAHTGVNE